MQLFLCEKPSQGNDIAKVLGAVKRGDGCIYSPDHQICVTWGIGHLVEQCAPEEYDPDLKRWLLETLPIIPAQWRVAPKKETHKQFKIVMALIKKAASIVIATDADREGEVIARELLDLAGYRGHIQRLWLSALDDASIRKALSTLKSNETTLPLYYAGLGRSRADWLIGMNFSRLFTLLAQQQGYQGAPLSVGRVQSPTLAMIVNRDREIAHFVPVAHYALVVQLNAGGQSFSAMWCPPAQFCDDEGRCLKVELVQQVQQQVTQANAATVTNIETTRENVGPPLLFALSDLQSECNRLYGMGAQQVLDIAQSLYETHKITTYPRTDCGYLPESQFTDVPKVIAGLVQTDRNLQNLLPRLNLQQKSRAWNDKKITAHHGIIPTGVSMDLSKLKSDELKVYDLIRCRYLAQFLPAFVVDKTQVSLRCAGHLLVAKGQVVIAVGWKMLFGKMLDESSDETEKQGLPALTVNQNSRVENSEIMHLKTTPPNHYTEGTLLAAMKNAARFVTNEELKKRLRETEGLGTEATRASVIETLLAKGFVQKKGKSLIATAAGCALIDGLPDTLKDPGLTALWEQALNQIAEGRLTLDAFMQKQAQFIRSLMARCLQQGMSLGNIEVKKCPECGKPMRKIHHPKGVFWGCTGYPQCQYKVSETKPAKKERKLMQKSGVNVSEQVNKLLKQL